MAWVLIVDDDEMVRDMLQTALQEAGYALVRVGDGEDALDVLRVSPYHAVVLLDLMMPGMNGLTVLKNLENNPELVRRHAWIVMSANHEELQRIPLEVRAKLGLSLLKKPFEIEQMLALVAERAAELPPDTLQRDSGTVSS